MSDNTNSKATGRTTEYMPLFDTRLYRTLGLYASGASGPEQIEGDSKDENHQIGSSQSNMDGGGSTLFYPHYSYGSYVSDYYPSPTAIKNTLDEFVSEYTGDKNSAEYKSTVDNYNAEIKKITDFNDKNKDQMMAPHSFIHPYAIVKLAGASGAPHIVQQLYTYDAAYQRKWYETDGDKIGGYAGTPTTTKLIQWGNEDLKGRTPYSFQDFVFCKHWNIIPNNRMITLRRYSMPVTDAITFSDYETAKNGNGNLDALPSNRPYSPLATAVTYFGEDTGNTLSELLSFSAKYNWKQIGEDNGNPIDVTFTQQEKGEGLAKGGGGIISSGLRMVSEFLGLKDTYEAAKNGTGGGIDPQLAAQDMPPDPYSDGPYMNRIMGPVNVIMDTYKREKGLKFTHDTLKVKFNYVARPIAGINNKAVLLDLLANILVLSYSSGTWFGGMWRFKTEKPAVYPFKYGDVMNKMYKGQIFGKTGAVRTLVNHAYSDGKGFIGTFFKEAFEGMKALVGGAWDLLNGKIKGDSEQTEEGKEKMASVAKSPVTQTIEKIIAAKVTQSSSIPYLQGQKALLTGLPVGDWHLTIGNPLNPIAMIGNLIVTNVSISFSDELGPDDFPIGFSAEIELKHGLGRDRDAIESMFNRGYGRIYSLPLDFKSTADGETKVDDNTGTKNSEPRTKYEETRNTFFGRGFRFIAKSQDSKLANSGAVFYGDTREYPSMASTAQAEVHRTVSSYMIDPWQTAWVL